MATKKVIDRRRKNNWRIFAQSYFLIAKLACQELQSARKDKHSKKSKLTIPYQSADLYVPILFNIKHGIELFIKTLSVFAHGEYEEVHDIQTLFSNAKAKISKLELIPLKKGYDDISKNKIDVALKDLEQIEEHVLYFFELEFLKKKLYSNFVVHDIHNDVLRYPDNKASIRIDWDTILNSRVDHRDIKEIQEKLDDLYELFNKTGYLHDVLNY